MEEVLRQHLLDLSSAYLSGGGLLAETTVARKAAGDHRFFDRQRAGKRMTTAMYDAVVAWFAANWPAGADWPAGVPRPPAAREDAE